MRESTVAKRYARALAQTIVDESEYRDILGQLSAIARLQESDVDFRSGMETLLLSKKQKREILDSLQERMRFSGKAINFLHALVGENRMMFLPAILPLLETYWFEKNGIEKLRVFSVVKLTDDQAKALAARLEESFRKKIVIDNILDPTLIGGIKIQRGSVFYDFSIEGNLTRLKETITEAILPESPVDLGAGDGNQG